MPALLTAGFEPGDLTPVGDWHPNRCTPTLTGDEETFTTDGDRLLAVVDEHWVTAEAFGFVLDAWQRWLIRRILETYPPDWPDVAMRGKLRYRQVVISVGRQNGKSVIGAVLAFYFTAMHVRGPRVVGLASVESQAKIVYDRLKYVVDENPVIGRELRATGTRGISSRSLGGMYKTLPSKEETAQGEPISGCLYDELHLGNSGLWDAIVKGQTARDNSLMVGITTAGDDDSLLLKRLYLDGDGAIAGNDERFGFFVWESITEKFDKTYVPTEADVIAANPAVACGRVSLAVAMSDALKTWRAPKDEKGVTGRDRVIRYTLNRFVDGSVDAWVSSALFNALVGDTSALQDGEVVYGIERTEDWRAATITAAAKRDGELVVEVVATITDPTHAMLVTACRRLATRGRSTFVVLADSLKALGKELRDEHGLRVWILGATEVQEACAGAAGLVQRGALVHAGDPIVRYQSARAKRRTSGDGWRVSRSLSSSDVDSVYSMIAALYVAEIQPELSMDLT